MAKITLSQAEKIIDAALAKGSEIECNPLSVVVLDDGGNLVAFKKQDNSSVLRFEIALGKASAAIGMGTSSRNIEVKAKERPYFINSLIAASGGKLVPVAGGLLIRSSQGEIIGAVGVTGDTSDRDEECGLAGIKAANLETD